MDDRCENCGRVIAELRAEVDQLRGEFVCRFDEILKDLVDEVETRHLTLLANFETCSLNFVSDVDSRVRGLLDTLAERFQLPLDERGEKGPPH
jgi:hypothetical protein